MKRNAYTLAETLLTIGIVGIVAALTLPTVTTSYRKQIYAKTLSSAVSSFNTAISTMIIKEDRNNLLETDAWQEVQAGNNFNLSNADSAATIRSFMARIRNGLSVSDYETNQLTYELLAGGAYSPLGGNGIRFKTNKGIEYLIHIDNASNLGARNELTASTQGYNYLNKAADVCIDVNGEENPNMLGRDLFCYELSTEGTLYPIGSRDQILYNNGVLNVDVEDLCVNQRNGLFCAEYLAQNEYEMDY